MSDLPLELLALLSTTRLRDRAPAWLRVDAAGEIRAAGGELERYGIGSAKEGSPAERAAPFLTGLLPFTKELPQLPVVQIADAATAEVSFLRAGEDVWVLLVDAAPRAAELRAVRQGENEWMLLRERLSATASSSDSVGHWDEISVVAVRVRPLQDQTPSAGAVLDAVVSAVVAVRAVLEEEAEHVERRGAQVLLALFAGEEESRVRMAVAAAHRVSDAVADLPAARLVRVGVGVASGAAVLGEPFAEGGAPPLVVGGPLERALDLAVEAMGAAPELDAPTRTACGYDGTMSPGAARPAVEAALEALDSVVLVPAARGELQAASHPPEWLASLFEPLDPAGHRWRARADQPFLQHAVSEAEELWRSSEPARALIGPWAATDASGRERVFESWAVLRGDGSRAMVVTAMEERHVELQQILQRAREARLGHEALLSEVEKKEILLHCIVHDLRGPLTTIQGGLSLLARGGLSEERERRVLELAGRQARKQEEMIRGILDVFAAELRALVGVEADPRAAPDLVAAALDAVERHTAQAARLGVRLEAAVGDAERLSVLARRDRLDRVFDNLILNALRHSPRGGTVRVSLEPAGEQVRLTVEDEGPGVPEDLIPSLFERFARGPNGGLAGLGLYACRLAVRSWGGEIGYEPREPGGARFLVLLQRLGERT